MKTTFLALCFCLVAALAHARLGETREQSEARYGLPKSERTLKGLAPLIDGARELTFHHAGFRIRCALLLASDGVEYIVREEYSKLAVPLKITQIEIDAIFEAETNALEWAPSPRVAPRKPGPQPKPLSQFVLEIGGSAWKRTDGAVAACGGGQFEVRLELPQASQWEDQVKVVKEQVARASAPKF